MNAKEIFNDFKENFDKVRKLLDEDSKNDPETDPYQSKYKALEILSKMRESLTQVLRQCEDRETNSDAMCLVKHKLIANLADVLLNIGVIHMETEELSNSDKVLTQAVELLDPHSKEPDCVTTLIKIYNNLGILWSTRDDPAKAKMYLMKSKELYSEFKRTVPMPLPIELIMKNTEFMNLEKAYTFTLYYLAQVYGVLKENLKSATYCHVTLRRQLEYFDYEPIDWVLNSATLSQFFAEHNMFYQSRHHLAAASTILDQYEEKLRASGADENNEVHLAKLETFKHRSADVARCWVKYCILLMTASKTRLMTDTEPIADSCIVKLDDDENVCNGDLKSLIFPSLDVSKYESKVTDKYLLTYQDARDVFLNCQTWLNKAKEYYKLDTLASDYIQVIQDCSQSYSYLAFFEEDDERRAKMHKRRIDMLEDLTKQVNPTYYLQYCRQLWFELGEIYNDILNIKLDKLNKSKEKPQAHTLKKINMLCEKSIENYDHFLDSVKDKAGKMPVKLEFDLIKPVVSAYAYIGRNSMKRIAVDKTVQLSNVRKSYDSYQAVVDICSNNQDAATMMHEEYSLCSEMAKILPLKIKKIESEIASQ